MTTGGWEAQIPDEAADYLRGVMDEHMPDRFGFCRCCGAPRCAKGREAAVGLAIAGRLDLPPAWAIPRPEPGRWP